MISRVLFLLIVLSLYVYAFGEQEGYFSETPLQISHPLPPIIQKIALGYLRQLGGEMQFVKASVFYGGVEGGRDPLEYMEPLAHHFSAAAQLHPHFIDTYFLCQSTLPHVNNDYALFANDVLLEGMKALPDEFFLPFFSGFNQFYYLKNPKKAAVLLKEAAQKSGSLGWVAHLASMLAAEGGDIYGGLMWLKAMHASEENEFVRKRYEHSITQFEKAVDVQEAIDQYKALQGFYPVTLENLIPQFLPTLPQFDHSFVLSWNPPTLTLARVSPE